MLKRLQSFLDRLKWPQVIFLVGGGAALFFFMQDNTEIEQREQGIILEQQQISNLERKIQEAKDFERQLEEKRKKYADLVKQLQGLKNALPKQFDLPELLSEILREAKQLEIEITVIRPDMKEEQGELYNSLGFTVETRGTFLQFFIFLDRLAHMSRLINVEHFTIGRDQRKPAITLGGEEGAFAGTKLSGGRGVYPGITGNIKILTYRYRGGSSSAASSTPAPAQGAGGKK